MRLQKLEREASDPACKELRNRGEQLLQRRDDFSEARRKRESTQEAQAQVENVVAFRELSVVPTAHDLQTPRDPLLPKNQIGRPWPDVTLSDRALVQGLRNGLSEALHGNGMRSKEVYLYHSVKVAGASVPRNSYSTFVKLSFVLPGKLGNRIAWNYSKRLLNGSLLCLIPERDKHLHIDECLIATVEERDPKKLGHGYVGVRFEADHLERLDWDAKYLMVESSCFFGAFAPVLHTLKTFESQSTLPLWYSVLIVCHLVGLPFRNLLLDGVEADGPPRYLLNHQMDISSLYTNLHKVLGRTKFSINGWCDLVRTCRIELIYDRPLAWNEAASGRGGGAGPAVGA